MARADAVGLLMGLAPAQFALDSKADSVSNDGTMLVATYGNAAAGTRELRFSDGNLAMVRETAAGGQVNYVVRYTDYHDIGGVMFPYTVDATFPAARQSRQVSFPEADRQRRHPRFDVRVDSGSRSHSDESEYRRARRIFE